MKMRKKVLPVFLEDNIKYNNALQVINFNDFIEKFAKDQFIRYA